MTIDTANTGRDLSSQQKPTAKAASLATVAAPVPTSDVAATNSQGLTFTTDIGASRSTWIAAFLVVAIVGWMGSGFVIPSEDTDSVVAREDPKPVAVAVTTSIAETVTQFYQAEGQALPDRDTMMRAEISGDIAEVFVSKGQDVEAGTVIARFDPTNNQADANRAAEELARAQREFDSGSGVAGTSSACLGASAGHRGRTRSQGADDHRPLCGSDRNAGSG